MTSSPITRLSARLAAIRCEYDCPHCGAGWEIGDEGIYMDDVEDNTTTTCDDCGGEFQLRCKNVTVTMETISDRPQ